MLLFWLHAGSLTHLLILFSLNSRDDFKFHFLLCRNLITSLRKFIIMSYFCMQFNIINSTSPCKALLWLNACLLAFQLDLGRLCRHDEWSGVVSAEVKEEYMTLQGRLQDYSLPHCSKVKSHLKFIWAWH